MFRFSNQKYISAKKFPYNEGIRSAQVFVIDENGERLGVLNIAEAIAKAKERGFDLVAVSPLAQPPVCKIMDYGKFLYRVDKEERKSRAKAKRSDIKGIRLSLKIGDHDAEVRRNKALEFFKEGHKVKLELLLRGRERAHMPLAVQKIEEFIASLGDSVKPEGRISQQGGKLSIIIAKK